MHYNINMKQRQESRPENEKNEGGKKATNNGGGTIRGLLGQAHNMLLVAGLVGGAGCGGAGVEAPKPPSPLDVRVTMVTPAEKTRPSDGGAEGKAKEEGSIETRRVAVIGHGHVEVDGRYFLKTKDWDTEKVWVLPKGYRLPTLDTPSEISAEFRGKNMKYDGRYYSEAEVPRAWEKGVDAAKSGASTKKEMPVPTPKSMEEEPAPLGTAENWKVLAGVALVRADGVLIIHAEGKEHRFSFQSGRPLPPMVYTLSGTLHAVPGGAEGARSIIFALRPLVGEWDPRRGVPPPTRFWKWEKTVTIRK